MKNTENIDLDNPEFLQVYDLIETTSASVFMTGKAGTGKSTFLRYITSNTRKKHVVLAPTGIAAVNAGGQTLHSFFQIPLKPLLPDDPEFGKQRLERRMKYSKEKIKLIRELELIVIDEISMVRADIIDFIDKILRHYSHRPHDPFGGKQLLMVGDIYQLEPVATPDVREILRRVYPNFYFFAARAFAETVLVPIELRKVYRQSDPNFISILDRVRSGETTAADLAQLNTRHVPGGDFGPELTMTIATTRNAVQVINTEHLEELTTPQFDFEARIQDDFPESSYPTDRVLTLKEGAQVVFVKNDAERRWVNGTLGRISFLNQEKVKVTTETGEEHTLDPEIWANVVYSFDEKEGSVKEEVKGTFAQYPIRLAWALTIHKSQGLTFSRLAIDIGNGAFAGGQTYVALSRATSLSGIFLTGKLSARDIIVSDHVKAFARSFNNSALVDSVHTLASARRAYIQAARAFDEGKFVTAYDAFASAVATHNELSDRRLRLIALRKLYHLADARNEAADLRRQLAEKDALLASLADEFVAMGETTLTEGWEVAAAKANFEKALRISPGHYHALIGLGRTYAAAGDPDAAVDALTAAVAVNPDGFEAEYHLGSIFLSIGDVANAIASLEKAVKAAPKQPEPIETLADAYEVAGDSRAAERFRLQAKRLRKKRKK